MMQPGPSLPAVRSGRSPCRSAYCSDVRGPTIAPVMLSKTGDGQLLSSSLCCQGRNRPFSRVSGGSGLTTGRAGPRARFSPSEEISRVGWRFPGMGSVRRCEKRPVQNQRRRTAESGEGGITHDISDLRLASSWSMLGLCPRESNKAILHSSDVWVERKLASWVSIGGVALRRLMFCYWSRRL